MAALAAENIDTDPTRAPGSAFDANRSPAVCVTCRNDEFVTYNSGEGRLEVYKCSACNKYFTRADVDAFLGEWEESLKKKLGKEKKKKKSKRTTTPEHLIPLCPDGACGGYMKSWRGDKGVDEIFRCDECCRPFHAKAVAKQRAISKAVSKNDAKNEANKGEDAPVIEATEAGFDMDDLDAPQQDED